MSFPANIEQYILSESVRQNAAPGPMLNAYSLIRNFQGPLNEMFILNLAACFGFNQYRTIPVVFENGGSAENPQNIPAAMSRAILWGTPVSYDFHGWYQWVKVFLKIHPFEDGNGRMASLLFNWGMGTLKEPIPLPFYHFF